jgi:hypothetical protein
MPVEKATGISYWSQKKEPRQVRAIYLEKQAKIVRTGKGKQRTKWQNWAPSGKFRALKNTQVLAKNAHP